MSVSDPIADMLTRIRNAIRAGHDVVEIPHSRIKEDIGRILKKEGFVTDFSLEGGAKKSLRLYLKYGPGRESVIQGLRRISMPGLRKYARADRIPVVVGGMGIAILTTPAGVMTGREARRKGVGGEVICKVW